MRYTQEQRAEGLALVAQVGAAEASRRLGIPKGTLDSWASRARVPAPSPNPVQVERRVLSVAERKAQLAEDLLDDIQRLRAQLFAPCKEPKAVVVSGGMHHPGHVEVVEVHLNQPRFADQRAIMTSIAIAVDKVQILTGEATARIEQLAGQVDPAKQQEQRARALGVVDQLAQRRNTAA